jgi:arsenate reductase
MRTFRGVRRAPHRPRLPTRLARVYAWFLRTASALQHPEESTVKNTPEPVTLWHNPRCGKSRAALALLQQRGIEPNIVEYLKTPPSAGELRAVLRKLGMTPEQLVRKGEDAYRALGGKALSEAQWIEAMVRNPILIERPIAIKGERAVVGRPPEKVLEVV